MPSVAIDVIHGDAERVRCMYTGLDKQKCSA